MSDYAVFGVQHADLAHLPSEAATLAAALGCEPVIGHVTETLIRRDLKGRTLDGIYIGSHATADGILMSSGVMSAESLAGIASNAIAPGGWLMIATCYSEDLLQTIQRGATVDVIAAVTGEVPDARAWSFVATLAEALRRHDGNMYQAWFSSRAAGNGFRYWPHPDNRGKAVPQNQNGSRITLEYLERQVSHQEQMIDRLRQMLDSVDRRTLENRYIIIAGFIIMAILLFVVKM